MAISVKYTPDFGKQLKKLSGKYPSVFRDLSALVDELEATPDIGTPLGKNLYKIRSALTDKSRGKSGGARVITYVL